MAYWVSLRPFFDMCARDMDYEGGGELRVMGWIQGAAEKQLKFAVEDILAAARVR